jgi:hypothetical protein
MYDEIKNAGYDIETTSLWLENFYLGLADAKKDRMNGREQQNL